VSELKNRGAQESHILHYIDKLGIDYIILDIIKK
jgi:hypothetical protein